MEWSERMEQLYALIGHLVQLLALWWQQLAERLWLQREQLRLWLEQLGVPAEQSLIVIYACAYLLVTLLVVLLVWRVMRRRRPVTGRPASQQPSIAAQDAAAVATKPVAGEATEALTRMAEAPLSLFERMRRGLAKTHDALWGRLDAVLGRAERIDAAVLEELEEILITADFGVKTTTALMTALQQRARSAELTAEAVRAVLREEILALLRAEVAPLELSASQPFVLLVVGVNGVGKTTTIGKLAQQFKKQGRSVLLGAGDTFRAAAAEQLAIWGERCEVPVIRHSEGADPAAVAFDAAKAAVARKVDLLIVDTAGRLHTKVNLMEEMKKIHRVLGREIAGAPHETLLVLDASTGQNALVQARLFQQAVGVGGIVLTKLDGTAKGGVAVAIAAELGLPVRYIGIGEGIDDLRPFDAEMFVDALFAPPARSTSEQS
ncbi:signal recognition particle-docking protein FtsY [Desulfuromonas thiophila]|uniref:signal recognition particle-docking protein FtsY n=1 Tax=Desulfuromonas thiophila TaxID=57664 RepID=UPI0029F4685F|nr:signal recognition particle-docking protein FtsY [Desulfuromonas thiophila]